MAIKAQWLSVNIIRVVVVHLAFRAIRIIHQQRVSSRIGKLERFRAAVVDDKSVFTAEECQMS